jgi:uncharacterized coiled-coil DUF342 family protein
MGELKKTIEKLADENGSILEGMTLLVDEIDMLKSRVDEITIHRHELSEDDLKLRRKPPNCS